MTDPLPDRVLLPPFYLPDNALLLKVLHCRELWMNPGEGWQKRSLRNRTRIIGPNGIQTLIIPLERSRRAQHTRDVRICYASAWMRVHLGAFEAAYNSSPFFSYFREDLFRIFRRKPVFLFDLNEALLQFLLKRAGLSLELQVGMPEGTVNDLSDWTPDDSSNLQVPPYPQVFENRYGFLPQVSALDRLANTGKL